MSVNFVCSVAFRAGQARLRNKALGYSRRSVFFTVGKPVRVCRSYLISANANGMFGEGSQP